MPERQLAGEASFWLWNFAFGAFFAWARAFVKQDFKNPATFAATIFMSLGSSMAAGHVLEGWGAPEWLVRAGIAVTALIAHDFIRAVLTFSQGFNGNTISDLLRWYARMPPKQDKADEEN